MNPPVALITPGRTGSHSLCALWRKWFNLPAFESDHPESVFLHADATDDRGEWLDDRHWTPGGLYTDMACFGAGFLEPMFERGWRFAYLDRPDTETAFSLLAMKMVPGTTERGMAYHPDATHLLHVSDYARCYWVAQQARKAAEDIRSRDPSRMLWFHTKDLPAHVNSLEDRVAEPNINDPWRKE